MKPKVIAAVVALLPVCGIAQSWLCQGYYISPPVASASVAPGGTTVFGFNAFSSLGVIQSGQWSIQLASPTVLVSSTTYNNGTFFQVVVTLTAAATGTHNGTVTFVGSC